MKAKRSIAIPVPLNNWLEKQAKKTGQSISALITHLLTNAMDKNGE